MQFVQVHKMKLELNAEEVPGSREDAPPGPAQPLTSVF